MKVTLINYTHKALETLLFTKNTRLLMAPNGLAEIEAWPFSKKMEELDYMRGTIQSSWEFVDYTFFISGVTRAFTHQLVRHRVGVSFAQQAQRAVDMSGFEFSTGPSIEAEPERERFYRQGMETIDTVYQALVREGAAPQDARGILPTNILTNITMKINLRALHEMLRKRLCVKAQGEFQDVARAMQDCVLDVHRWADRFLKVECAWNGTCLFPSYPKENCPVKPGVYNPVTGTSYDGDKPLNLVQIEMIWRNVRAEAQPGLPKEVKA